MRLKLATVAICFTNNDSGFLYSFKSDYEKNPLKIDEYRWLNPNQVSSTTPTCILFTKDKVFHSFGREAKNKYAELVEDEEHRDWYFFERFLSFLDMQEVCIMSFKYLKSRLPFTLKIL